MIKPKWKRREQPITFSRTGGLVVNEENGRLFFYTSDQDQVWSYDPATFNWTFATEKVFVNGRQLSRFAFQYGNNKTLAIVPFWGTVYGLYNMKALKVLARTEDTKKLVAGVSVYFPDSFLDNSKKAMYSNCRCPEST